MQLVLLENIKNLGKIGDLVKVKRGFGRNFLIKYGKALIASKLNIDLVNKKKDELNLKNLELKKAAKKIFDIINNAKCKFSKKAKENGELYGSIRPVELSRNLSEVKKVEIKPSQIDLTKDYSNDKSLPKLTVHSEPLDLAIGITPFNHPLNLVVHKVAPAIVAGTPIVIKPSEKTPLTAIKLREILIKSGLPENHYNIILGSRPKETTDAILSYQKYDLVSFTGGVKVGKYIARKMARSGNELKKYIPELGGNAILVIMGDCDIDVAIQLAMGAFENSGQRCTAVRRILLHRDIANQFIEKFVNVAKNIKFGDPLDNNNDMGTVISSEQADLIHRRASSAIKDGASLLIGNRVDGAIYSPTIVSNVNQKSELVQKETQPFDLVSNFPQPLLLVIIIHQY